MDFRQTMKINVSELENLIFKSIIQDGKESLKDEPERLIEDEEEIKIFIDEEEFEKVKEEKESKLVFKPMGDYVEIFDSEFWDNEPTKKIKK